ncbi:hypothetical protein [Sphingomonas lycopersici]|uniref:Uncharacterized protein n=1 Tax=Sphingomonas lycopersici TaxID=2951807 RepID=A0AA41ZC15_9SPHN|nr:hypothetical protein [Sphingomonas lycopersici]MCW6534144.1 hypothetical protein [Sphingomonas lycopersici]
MRCRPDRPATPGPGRRANFSSPFWGYMLGSVTGDDRFNKLNERQRHYLRAVLIRQNSAEIARAERERGNEVSKAAIDKVIKQAMERIGTNSRFDAARQFAEYEARQGVHRLDLPPEDLLSPRQSGAKTSSSNERDQAINGDISLTFRDTELTFGAISAGNNETLAPAALGPTGTTPGVIWSRVWRSLAITLALVLATIALGNMYAQLSR